MAVTPRLSWTLRVTPSDQELLVEQAWSAMEPEAYEAFCRQLDAPANPNERLQRTMTATRPWQT
jgi:uncharacterized protein (DUF1778 family)